MTFLTAKVRLPWQATPVEEHLWAIRTLKSQQQYVIDAANAPIQGPKPKKKDPKIPLRRGKWEFHYVTVSDGRQVGAWQYDGQEFWLRLKEGWDNVCTQHWDDRKRPRRWYMHTTSPETWIRKASQYWYWNSSDPLKRQEPYGRCTHRKHLGEAMEVAEKYLAEQVMKALKGVSHDLPDHR